MPGPTPRRAGDPAPFDAAAFDYDARFAHTRLGELLRTAVHRRLAHVVNAGDRVLDLGCGTGEDALWMAQRGARVLATDASTAMLAVAARKAADAGLSDRITFERLDLARIADESPGHLVFGSEPYDAVVADFGVLNCLPDRTVLAGELTECMRRGGSLVLVLMSPVCLWEILWHLARGRPRDAFRRFRSGEPAHLGPETSVRVWYPSASRVRREFAPGFRHRETAGIGTVLPPSYLAHLVEDRPRLLERAARWDDRLGAHWPWSRLSDHYLTILERR